MSLRASSRKNTKLRRSLWWSLGSSVFFLDGCALFVQRPVQEMSYTAAAIRAAREVRAETLLPELMTQANELFFQAKQEYRLKKFSEALDHTRKARKLAEEAEYLALCRGGDRSSEHIADPYAEGFDQHPTQPQRTPSSIPKSPPPNASGEAIPNSYVYPTPAGVLATEYEAQKKKQEDHRLELEKIQAQPTPFLSIPAAAPQGSIPSPGIP